MPGFERSQTRCRVTRFDLFICRNCYGHSTRFYFGSHINLLFINDLSNCINKCQCNMFADDTIIYLHSPTLQGVRSY